MSQISNDCKGLTNVTLDNGTILFNRQQVTSTGTVNSTTSGAASGAVLKASANWVGLAGNCIDLFRTVASGTGLITLTSGGQTFNTATTGPVAG